VAGQIYRSNKRRLVRVSGISSLVRIQHAMVSDPDIYSTIQHQSSIVIETFVSRASFVFVFNVPIPSLFSTLRRLLSDTSQTSQTRAVVDATARSSPAIVVVVVVVVVVQLGAPVACCTCSVHSGVFLSFSFYQLVLMSSLAS
jgi:hypothetical protein